MLCYSKTLYLCSCDYGWGIVLQLRSVKLGYVFWTRIIVCIVWKNERPQKGHYFRNTRLPVSLTPNNLVPDTRIMQGLLDQDQVKNQTHHSYRIILDMQESYLCTLCNMFHK